MEVVLQGHRKIQPVERAALQSVAAAYVRSRRLTLPHSTHTVTALKAS